MNATILNRWLAKHVTSGSRWWLRCPGDVQHADTSCVVLDIRGYDPEQVGEWDIEISGFSVQEAPGGAIFPAMPTGHTPLPRWYLSLTGQNPQYIYTLPGVKFQELAVAGLLRENG